VSVLGSASICLPVLLAKSFEIRHLGSPQSHSIGRHQRKFQPHFAKEQSGIFVSQQLWTVLVSADSTIWRRSPKKIDAKAPNFRRGPVKESHWPFSVDGSKGTR
jgi:hypothetical protein